MASAAEKQTDNYDHTAKTDVERRGSVARTEKGRWERLWPVIACGAGLFSDGYLNNVRHSNATSSNGATTQATYPEQRERCKDADSNV
jgi:hypothetical protein